MRDPESNMPVQKKNKKKRFVAVDQKPLRYVAMKSNSRLKCMSSSIRKGNFPFFFVIMVNINAATTDNIYMIREVMSCKLVIGF